MAAEDGQAETEQSLGTTVRQFVARRGDQTSVGHTTRTRRFAAPTLDARFESFVGSIIGLDAAEVKCAHDLDPTPR